MTVSSLLRTGAVALALTTAAAGTVVLTAGASSAANKDTGGSGRTLTSVLDGASEVGPNGETNVGDPDGAGQATITINPGREQLCFDLRWQDIGRLAAAHVHEAPAGVNGPVVVDFPSFTFTPGVAKGCVSVERALLRDILVDPANYYLNFHTAEFPGGAVRGQLSK